MGAFTMAFKKEKRLIPPFYNLDDAVTAVKNLKEFSQHKHHEDGHLPLHFVRTGNEAAPAVLFIHGSPGMWEGWAEYLHSHELRSKALLVAVDRPGYGGSNNGISGATLKEQSDTIVASIKSAFPHKKKWIIVGHSYGGPVALRLMADYPDFFSSSLLLAPAISPSLVRVRWYNRVADLPVVRSLISTHLHRSNEEMFLLSDELSKMKPDLSSIKNSVIIIQGQKDGIVHPGNVAYAEETLVNTTVQKNILPQRGHFLPWEEYDLIKGTLLKELQK